MSCDILAYGDPYGYLFVLKLDTYVKWANPLCPTRLPQSMRWELIRFPLFLFLDEEACRNRNTDVGLALEVLPLLVHTSSWSDLENMPHKHLIDAHPKLLACNDFKQVIYSIRFEQWILSVSPSAQC